MADIILGNLQSWVFWVIFGYILIGGVLGCLFGSACAWLHPDNHVWVWVILWPAKLLGAFFSTIVTKIACKKYGHVDKDYDRGYSMNSDTVELYCNRCGKLLKTISIDEVDSKTKEGIDAFNEVGNKMFPKGKDVDLRIIR